MITDSNPNHHLIDSQSQDVDQNIIDEQVANLDNAFDSLKPSLLSEDLLKKHGLEFFTNQYCQMCPIESDVNICEGCPKTYHTQCVARPSDIKNQDFWFCDMCLGKDTIKICTECAKEIADPAINNDSGADQNKSEILRCTMCQDYMHRACVQIDDNHLYTGGHYLKDNDSFESLWHSQTRQIDPNSYGSYLCRVCQDSREVEQFLALHDPSTNQLYPRITPIDCSTFSNSNSDINWSVCKYYVKFQRASNWHNCWISYDKATEWNNKFKLFQKKVMQIAHSNASYPSGQLVTSAFDFQAQQESEFIFKSAVPERVLTFQCDLRELHQDGQEQNMIPWKFCLVKWRDEDYSQCTWEYTFKLLNHPQGYKALQRYLIEHQSDLNPIQKLPPFMNFNHKSNPEEPKKYNLLDYQKTGVEWILKSLSEGRNVVLADEPGLGKTAQTLSVLKDMITTQQIPGPFLIVTPLSTLQKWRQELEFWLQKLPFESNMNILVYHGHKKARQIALDLDLYERSSFNQNCSIKDKYRNKQVNKVYLKNYQHTVLLASTEAMALDYKEFVDIAFQLFVLDEGKKARGIVQAKFLKNLKQLTHWKKRILLSSMPLSNSFAELSNLFEFLDSQKCDKKFQKQIENQRQAVSSIQLANEDNPLQDFVRKNIKPYLLRRTIKSVYSMTNLPKIIEIQIELPSLTFTQLLIQRQFLALKLQELQKIDKFALSQQRKAYLQSQSSCSQNVNFVETDEIACLESLQGIISFLSLINSHPQAIFNQEVGKEFQQAVEKLVQKISFQQISNGDEKFGQSAKFTWFIELINQLYKQGQTKVLVLSEFNSVLTLLNELLSLNSFKAQYLCQDKEITDFSAQDSILLLCTQLSTQIPISKICNNVEVIIVFDENQMQPYNILQFQQRIQKGILPVYKLKIQNSIEIALCQEYQQTYVPSPLQGLFRQKSVGFPKIELDKSLKVIQSFYQMIFDEQNHRFQDTVDIQAQINNYLSASYQLFVPTEQEFKFNQMLQKQETDFFGSLIHQSQIVKPKKPVQKQNGPQIQNSFFAMQNQAALNKLANLQPEQLIENQDDEIDDSQTEAKYNSTQFVTVQNIEETKALDQVQSTSNPSSQISQFDFLDIDEQDNSFAEHLDNDNQFAVESCFLNNDDLESQNQSMLGVNLEIQKKMTPIDPDKLKEAYFLKQKLKALGVSQEFMQIIDLNFMVYPKNQNQEFQFPMYLKLFGLNSQQITDANQSMLKYSLTDLQVQNPLKNLFEALFEKSKGFVSLQQIESDKFVNYCNWVSRFMGQILETNDLELVFQLRFKILNGLTVGHFAERKYEFLLLNRYLINQGELQKSDIVDNLMCLLVLKHGWGEWRQITQDKSWILALYFQLGPDQETELLIDTFQEYQRCSTKQQEIEKIVSKQMSIEDLQIQPCEILHQLLFGSPLLNRKSLAFAEYDAVIQKVATHSALRFLQLIQNLKQKDKFETTTKVVV